MRRYHALAVLICTLVLLNACAFGAGTAEPTAAPGAGGATAPTELVGAPSAAPDTASTSAAAEPETITFGGWEEERSVYAPLIAAFEKDNPSIHVQFVALDSILQTLNDFRLGTRDIMSAVDTAAVTATPEAIAQGWVRDLTPLMDADASFDRADFYPGVLQAVSKDNATYLVPRILHVPLLFYNKDLATAGGVPEPKPGWSWNDVTALAEQVAQKRGDDKTDVYGLLDLHLLAALPGELTTAGVNVGESSSTPLDDPKVVAAMERVVGLIKSGAIYSPDPSKLEGNLNFQNFEQYFADRIRDQRIAIWSPDLIGFMPELSTPPFQVGATPFPAPLLFFFSSIEGYSMSNGTEHPEAAWRWLSFLSRQEVTSPFLRPIGPDAVPARLSLAERIGYWQKQDERTTAALKSVLDSPEMGQLIGVTISNYDGGQLEPAVHAVVSGDQTLAQALRQAEQARTEQLAQQPQPTSASAPIVVATPVPEAPAGAAKITFGARNFVVDQIRRLAQTFNQSNPNIFVEVKSISTESGFETLPLAEVARTTDCFADFNPPSPAEVTATLDLQPLIDADGNFPIDDYPPTLLAAFKYGTALHGLPYAVDFRVLNYNQTAFDAAQIAHPTAEWTLDDLLNAAQKLTRGSGANKQYGFASTIFQTRDVFFFLDRSGAPLTTGSGATQQPNFTDPKVVQAIQSYLDLLHTASPHTRLQGYIRNDFPNDGYQPITEGRAGMWFDFGTNFLDIGAAANQRFTWAIAPPPLGSGALTAHDFLVRGLYISAQTQQRDACWAWLKSLSNDVAGLGNGFPARTSLAESDAFVQQAPAGAADVDKAYRTALDRAPSTDSALEQPNRSQIDYFWFFRAVDRALQGQDLERELDAAQTLTEQFLTCVRGGAKPSECATQVDPDYQGRDNSP